MRLRKIDMKTKAAAEYILIHPISMAIETFCEMIASRKNICSMQLYLFLFYFICKTI